MVATRAAASPLPDSSNSVCTLLGGEIEKISRGDLPGDRPRRLRDGSRAGAATEDYPADARLSARAASATGHHGRRRGATPGIHRRQPAGLLRPPAGSRVLSGVPRFSGLLLLRHAGAISRRRMVRARRHRGTPRILPVLPTNAHASERLARTRRGISGTCATPRPCAARSERQSLRGATSETCSASATRSAAGSTSPATGTQAASPATAKKTVWGPGPAKMLAAECATQGAINRLRLFFFLHISVKVMSWYSPKTRG